MKKLIGAMLLMLISFCFANGVTMKEWCWNYINNNNGTIIFADDGYFIDVSFSNCIIQSPFPFGKITLYFSENETEKCFYECNYLGLTIFCPQWDIEILCAPNLEFENYLVCDFITHPFFMAVQPVETFNETTSDNGDITDNDTNLDNGTSDNGTSDNGTSDNGTSDNGTESQNGTE